jgi:hypothetical protein
MTSFNFFEKSSGTGQVNGSFKGLQANKAGNAFFDVLFDVFAGHFIQFVIEILGKLLKQFQAVFMIVLIFTHFQNTLSICLLKISVPGVI